MPLGIDLRTRILPCATLVCLALNANTAMAQSIQGTATFRERLTLPPAALFEAFLENVDAPAEPLGLARIPSPGNPPFAFTIAYDPGKIVADRRYVVRARILVGEQLWFTSDTATPVITRGAPVTVSIMLRRVEAGQTPQAKPAARPIAGTYWRAIELIGKPTPTQQASQEAHLIFQPDGRVAGADGCNRVAGSYELKGDAVKFGPLVGTQMACLNTAEVERGFREALETAARLVVTGDRLELFDTGGRLVAVFTGRAQAAVPPTPPGLAGTSWQLVKFQGSDARCPEGSLHDQMVKQWGNIRSYVVRDGHLFLPLMADGGIYQFEPAVSPSPPFSCLL